MNESTAASRPQQIAADSTSGNLPSAGRLLAFAMLLPAAVALSNQLLFTGATGYTLRTWLYPWMALSTAVLSWCVGRYLFPGWLRWIVIAWGLALLDCLTIAACLGGAVPAQLGYVLVSAQISLLVLWAILGPGIWQWRLPIVAAIVPLVLIFSGSFVSDYWGDNYVARVWNIMMLLMSLVAGALCAGLRYFGFTLHQILPAGANRLQSGQRPRYQFGLKHLFIWLTVTGPLLLFVRGLDLDGKTVFPVLLVAVSIATVNLFAIWAVLGEGLRTIRVTAVLLVPLLIGIGLQHYSASLRAATGGTMPYRFFRTISYALIEMEHIWIPWLSLDAALLAALLLFLRASGYQLTRSDPRDWK